MRTALITGGSGGIGKACGRKLVELGYDVILTARREEPLRAAAEEMGARYVVADATEPEKFEPAVQAAGEIDLVVHAAGILGGTYARKQTFEQWRATMSANLDSCFVVTSAALPRMKAGSRFVFISSSAAHEPMRARTAYSASKAGMNAFALALAQEVDRDGINVHIVTPGPVETDMLQDVPFEMYAIRAADVAEAVAWLDTVDPSVDLPEIRLHAITRGPVGAGTGGAPRSGTTRREAPDGPHCRPRSLPFVVGQIHLRLHLMEDPVSLTAPDQQPRDPAGTGPFDVGLPAGQAPAAEQQGTHDGVVDNVALVQRRRHGRRLEPARNPRPVSVQLVVADQRCRVFVTDVDRLRIVALPKVRQPNEIQPRPALVVVANQIGQGRLRPRRQTRSHRRQAVLRAAP